MQLLSKFKLVLQTFPEVIHNSAQSDIFMAQRSVFCYNLRMKRQILQIGAPILTQPTVKVQEYDSEETLGLIADLLDTCNVAADVTAGLSAPQIGSNLAVCICRRVDLEEKHGDNSVTKEELWEVMINPEIVSTSADKSMFWEGCLSIGSGANQLFGPVERPKEVRVKYVTTSGETQELIASGYFAHVVQHELDHLQGLLFLQYISNPENIWRSDELDDYLEEYGDYPDVE